jgi:flagellar protein FliO/FliZ
MLSPKGERPSEMKVSLLWFTPVLALSALPLLLALSRWLRTSNLRVAPGSARSLTLKETIALDPKRRVHLMECRGRQVMVLTGGAQDVVIGWVPDA